MGIRAAVAGFLAGLKTKAGSPASYGGGYGGGSFWANAFRGRRQLLPVELVEAFQSIVYACATLNAGAVARVPLRLYARTGRGQPKPKCLTRSLGARERHRLTVKAASAVAGAEDVEEVTEHPLLDMIESPCPGFHRQSLLTLWTYYLDILGWFLARPEAARVGELLCWPLQSQYALPVRSTAKALVESFTYFGESYPTDELIWGRFVSPRDPYGYGYGPTQAAAELVGLHSKFIGVQDNLLSSGLKPSATLSPKDGKSEFGEAERRRIEADVNAGFAGDRAGRVLVLPYALDLKPFSLPPSDLGSLNIADNVLQRTANIFGVPISMLTSETNLANVEASHQQHAETAVEPRCILIAGALTAWTHTQGKANGLGWDRLFWLFDDPSQENRESVAKVFQIESTAGAMTINEYRAERGQPPVKWGEEPWLPSSVSQPSKRPEPGEMPGPGQPEGKPGEDGKPEPEPDAETKVLSEALVTLKAIRGAIGKGFAEKEPRDESGRWTSGGGSRSGGGKKPDSKPAGLPDRERYGTDRLAAGDKPLRDAFGEHFEDDAHFGSGPALSARDEKARAVAEKEGKVAVRTVERPQVESGPPRDSENGSTHEYRVGDEPAARVGVWDEKTGEHYVEEIDPNDETNPEFYYHDSLAAAQARAARIAARVQAAQTVTRYQAVPGDKLEKYIEQVAWDETLRGGRAESTDLHMYVIRDKRETKAARGETAIIRMKD